MSRANGTSPTEPEPDWLKPGEYFRVPSWVLAHAAKITPAGIAVYCALASHVYKNPTCWPSNETIAALAGCSVRTVVSVMPRLKAAGLVKAHRPKGPVSTTYELIRPAPDSADSALSVPPDSAESARRWRKSCASIAQNLHVDSANSAPEVPQGINSKNQQQQRKGAPAGTTHAAAVAESKDREDREEQIAALVERGLPATLARSYCSQASDPALIREILAYHQANLADWQKPVGALRSMLKDPAEWGFERSEAGWQRPPSAKVAPKASAVAQALARAQRTREELAAAAPASQQHDVAHIRDSLAKRMSVPPAGPRQKTPPPSRELLDRMRKNQPPVPEANGVHA